MSNSVIVLYICSPIVNADMVELVDTLDLGSSAARRVGSTPSIRTIIYFIYNENLYKERRFR